MFVVAAVGGPDRGVGRSLRGAEKLNVPGVLGSSRSTSLALRKTIVWAEDGEAGSTRRFLPPPARGAASYQSNTSGSGVRKD